MDPLVRNQRTLPESLIDIFGLAAAGSAAVVMASSFGTIGDATTWFARVVDFALSAVSEAKWVFPTFLGVIVALYGILIGQAIAGRDARAVVLTTNNVARGAQAIVAVTLIYCGLAIVAAISQPDSIGALFSVIVVGAIITLLGTSAGSFAYGTPEERRAVATASRNFHAKALTALRDGASRKASNPIIVWTVLGVSVGPAIFAGFVTQALPMAQEWFVGAVLYAFITALNGTVVVLGTYVVLTDRGSWPTRIFAAVPLAIPVIFTLISFLGLEGSPGSGLILGCSVALAAAFFGVSAWLPLLPSVRKQWKYSLGSALVGIAYRRAQRHRAKQAARVRELSVANST